MDSENRMDSGSLHSIACVFVHGLMPPSGKCVQQCMDLSLVCVVFCWSPCVCKPGAYFSHLQRIDWHRFLSVSICLNVNNRMWAFHTVILTLCLCFVYHIASLCMCTLSVSVNPYGTD